MCLTVKRKAMKEKIEAAITLREERIDKVKRELNNQQFLLDKKIELLQLLREEKANLEIMLGSLPLLKEINAT